MTLDLVTSLLIVLATALVCATWEARRHGNDKRDVALLAVLSSVFGVGSAATAVL